MARFGPATLDYFSKTFDRPTAVQERGWPIIASGQHALLIAPTGSGKTLAAFLWCIDRLMHVPPVPAQPTGRKSGRGKASAQTKEPVKDGVKDGVRVLYVSPLKALVYDIERNLRAPLLGIERAARDLGEAVSPPRVAIRTGDTRQSERRRQIKHPGQILVTTPESLYLILGSQARETLRTVETVIVDEVHALAPTKRGAHLALSLERLTHVTGREPQRIGLSATARPLSQVAAFLGGDRPVTIVDTSEPPRLDLQVVVPAGDMTRPNETAALPPANAPDDTSDTDHAGHQAGNPAGPPGAPEPRDPDSRGMWPVIHPHLLSLVRSHASTIIFVNSRALCERLCHAINDLAGDELLRSHHGSLSHAERRQVEQALGAGELAGIVATSSLELGIDMEAVDLVVLVESPGAAARGLQRIGRAGHGVGQTSKGRLFPKHRGDLLEAAVVARAMMNGVIEALAVPQNPLDVLAQQIVAEVASVPADTWSVENLAAMIRRAGNFRELPDSAYRGVLDMLSGRYPSSAFADLEPRIVWDRHADTLSSRRGAKTVSLVNGGTIPDRGLYSVYYGDVRVGELDEEMVQETQPGELFTLGATTWHVEEITRDRVMVTPAPGQIGKLPFWRGDGPGRPIELGEALGAFVREFGERLGGSDGSDGSGPNGANSANGSNGANDVDDAELPGDRRAAVEIWLGEEYRLDSLAARNLVDYVWREVQVCGVLPDDRTIVIQRFPDELGDDRICVLSPFGSRVHAPWALILQARLGAITGHEIKTLWSDDGIVLRSAGGARAGTLQRGGLSAWQLREALLPAAEDIAELITSELAGSALFASQFRENASRALLMPRRRPGQRTPLWVQRLKSQELLAVARTYASFPIVIETYRSCLQDVFDLDALSELLTRIARGEIAIEIRDTPAPSPFARSLVFAYVAAFLYEGDAPLAERRAQALTLDRELLRELLGSDDLGELLDPEVIAEVEAALQRLPAPRDPDEPDDESPDYRARHADGVHDLLRRLGELDLPEIAARTAGDPAEMLDSLRQSGRAVPVEFALPGGAVTRWVAVEDVARYRDALAIEVPVDVPRSVLAAVSESASESPLAALVERYARTHGPFRTDDLAARYGAPIARIDALLAAAQRQGAIVDGRFRPEPRTGQTTAGKSGPIDAGDTQWCHPDVLRRMKRQTLARLRDRVAPVPAAQLARFLPKWHGLARSVMPGGHGSQGRSLPPVSHEASMTRLQEALIQLEGLPLPYRELEDVILPARVADFSPRMLDELGAMGWLSWVGCGALGSRDGKVALYRRDRVAALYEPPGLPELGAESESESESDDLGALHRAILAHLDRNGASFFVAIQSACAAAVASSDPPTADAVLDALWELVWAGLVTNDTLQPLRALALRPRQKRSQRARTASARNRAGQGGAVATGWRSAGGRRGRPGRRPRRPSRQRSRETTAAASGRWSLTRDLVGSQGDAANGPGVRAPSATERAHGRALALLERHGIVTRECVAIEQLPGGFSAVYPVLRAMEEAGKVRRGYFVEGLGGAQFALAGAVDMLRASGPVGAPGAVSDAVTGEALLLSAVDPANPYGWLVPWPGRGAASDGGESSARQDAGDAARDETPRRIAGASVVLVGGRAVLYLDPGGRKLLTFAAAADPDVLARAVRALDRVAAKKRGKTLRIATIDGAPAHASSRKEAFLNAGYHAEPRGLVRELRLFEVS